MCQRINVDVNPLLAYLGAWILALLAHLSQLTHGCTLHFELKKMKVVKIEFFLMGIKVIMHQEKDCVLVVNTLKINIKNFNQ